MRCTGVDVTGAKRTGEPPITIAHITRWAWGTICPPRARARMPPRSSTPNPTLPTQAQYATRCLRARVRQVVTVTFCRGEHPLVPPPPAAHPRLRAHIRASRMPHLPPPLIRYDLPRTTACVGPFQVGAQAEAVAISSDPHHSLYHKARVLSPDAHHIMGAQRADGDRHGSGSGSSKSVEGQGAICPTPQPYPSAQQQPLAAQEREA